MKAKGRDERTANTCQKSGQPVGVLPGTPPASPTTQLRRDEEMAPGRCPLQPRGQPGWASSSAPSSGRQNRERCRKRRCQRVPLPAHIPTTHTHELGAPALQAGAERGQRGVVPSGSSLSPSRSGWGCPAWLFHPARMLPAFCQDRFCSPNSLLNIPHAPGIHTRTAWVGQGHFAEQMEEPR